MATSVVFSPSAILDFGERTPDRRMLAESFVRSIVDTLGQSGGLPSGCQLQAAEPMPLYRWSDGNWEIDYSRQESARLIGSSRIVVTILAIRLKKPGIG